MGKYRNILIILTVIIFIVLLAFYLIGAFKPKGAGIYIETDPVSIVYINGNQVGQTPFDGIYNPEEITIKLIPEETDQALLPFETKVKLVSSIKTIIKREFAKSEDESSGEIASFERVGGKESSLSIVSIPDAAQISIDGQIRGFAPYKVNSILPGDHELTISAPNYLERTLSIKAKEGFKLTVVVKLALSSTPVSTPIPSPTPAQTGQAKNVYVEILTTPNGFLRVRESPSTEAKEVSRVNSGSKLPFIEEDTKAGWFKIEYEKGKEGWVSSEYAKKVEGTI